MNKKFLMTAVLATSSFGSAFASESTLSTKLDINKINQVIADAKNQALPEFSEYIQDANISIDPVTFDLDNVSFNVDADILLKKSSWSQRPTGVELGLGTKLEEIKGEQKLVGNLKAALRTQMLTLAKFLVGRFLEDAPSAQQDSVSEALFRSYFNDVMAANGFESVVDRTLVLIEAIYASKDPSFDEAKESLKEFKFSKVNGALNVSVVEVEAYGAAFSVNLLANDETASIELKVVDMNNNALRSYATDLKEAIYTGLLEIQEASEKTKAEIRSYAADLFSYARELVEAD